MAEVLQSNAWQAAAAPGSSCSSTIQEGPAAGNFSTIVPAEGGGAWGPYDNSQLL